MFLEYVLSCSRKDAFMKIVTPLKREHDFQGLDFPENVSKSIVKRSGNQHPFVERFFDDVGSLLVAFWLPNRFKSACVSGLIVEKLKKRLNG